MSSFSAILSSLQNGNQKGVESQSQALKPDPARPTASPVTKNVAVKRKAEVEPAGSNSKVARTGSNGLGQSSQVTMSKLSAPETTKPKVSREPVASAYRGTPRPSSNAPSAKPVARSPAKSVNPVTGPATPIKAAPPPPKRGFASILERAKAAQEAAKIAGYDTIKHKATERLSKRDRLRIAQESKQPNQKNGKAQSQVGSRSGTPTGGRNAVSNLNKSTEAMERKGPVRKKVQLAYSGTMRAGAPAPHVKTKKTKDLAQDRYGGYASWSDLDDAEDDEEEDDEESGSDMEEAGFDDMLDEEMQSSRIARREDQEALAEEERLKREKAERKKRLLALNKDAASKRKY